MQPWEVMWRFIAHTSMSGLVVLIWLGAMLISVTFVIEGHAHTHGLGSLLSPWWCSWVVLTSPANAQWYRHAHGRVGPPSLANSCMVLHSWYLLAGCRLRKAHLPMRGWPVVVWPCSSEYMENTKPTHFLWWWSSYRGGGRHGRREDWEVNMT